jgi:hypothetical protein
VRRERQSEQGWRGEERRGGEEGRREGERRVSYIDIIPVGTGSPSLDHSHSVLSQGTSLVRTDVSGSSHDLASRQVPKLD